MKFKLVLLLTPFVFLACKKNENGKEGCTYKAASNYNADAEVDDGSCEFKGCTDSEASNYNANALVDDGSCTYAWMQYIGTYDIEADPSTFMDAHESVISKGPAGNKIVISNFRNEGESLSATLIGNGNEFEYSAVIDGAGYIGTGFIVDNVITLDYAACEDYNYPDNCDESYDEMTLTRQ